MAGRPAGRSHKSGTKDERKRRDSNRAVLKTGESQRSDTGIYCYRWTDKQHKRHTIYASTLKELRQKEDDITRDHIDGIRTYNEYTLNDLYILWCRIKKGLRDSTFSNYKYMYEQFVKDSIGRMRIKDIKKSTLRAFYNGLIENSYMKVSTVDTVHNIIHQLLEIAVDDGYLRVNPADRALTELKRSKNHDVKKVKALTKKEEDALLGFIRDHEVYGRWYPIFAVLLGTGMRIGEATGLRWVDVDLERGFIDVNHTLVYYSHGKEEGCAYEINNTKTPAGFRMIPIMSSVREAFLMEKAFQERAHIKCNARIAGYMDFVFLNRFGSVMNQGIINKVIRRIVRDYNEVQFLKAEEGDISPDDVTLLPMFSCHSLRHTFATRMVEAGVNVKVVQEVLGHADVSTTLNIYTDAGDDFKKDQMHMMEMKFGADKEEESDNNVLPFTKVI